MGEKGSGEIEKGDRRNVVTDSYLPHAYLPHNIHGSVLMSIAFIGVSNRSKPSSPLQSEQVRDVGPCFICSRYQLMLQCFNFARIMSSLDLSNFSSYLCEAMRSDIIMNGRMDCDKSYANTVSRSAQSTPASFPPTTFVRFVASGFGAIFIAPPLSSQF